MVNGKPWRTFQTGRIGRVLVPSQNGHYSDECSVQLSIKMSPLENDTMVFNKQTVLDLLNADFTQDHSRNIENSVRFRNRQKSEDHR